MAVIVTLFNLICVYLQVFNKLIRRYKYLEKAFEDEIKKVMLMAIFTGMLIFFTVFIT